MRISSPLAEIQEHYDVIVIGSGYGGSIAASRMARAGRTVCLLERGREIRPGDYPDTLIQGTKELQMHTPGGHVGSTTGLFDLHANAEQNVLVGCGLGGTSLINANVALEATPLVFEDPRWPQSIREHQDTLLAEGYAHAREMLRPMPYPKAGAPLPKLDAHRKSAEVMGFGSDFYLPPINVTFDAFPGGINHVGVEQLPCNNCGDCVTGCNNKAKNTTLMNYLPDAWNHGAEIYCQAAVSHIERDGDTGWIVHYQNVGVGREKFAAPSMFVRAGIVIVSAGTLGSTEIMLRSAQKGLATSDQLGEHFSGNGDILGFGYNCDDTINGIGFGDNDPTDMKPVGPCITSVIDLRAQDKVESRMVIEEGSIPGALGHVMLPALAIASRLIGEGDNDGIVDFVTDKARELDSLVRGPSHGAIHNLQTYLIMSHDKGNGRMVLDDSNQLRIDWPRVGLEENFIIGNERLEAATKALDGTYVPNPTWTKLLKHAVISVHPLGGCVMGEDAVQGVVNHKGQVFSGKAGTDVHPDLYITDGSVIPTSLAVNPLLTISAISERAMRMLADDRGWMIDYTLPSAPRKNSAPEKIGIEFTETMSGYLSTADRVQISTDLPAYEAAFERGKADNSPISFTLTIASGNLTKLLNDPAHPAAMSGTLCAPVLSAQPLTVSHGAFNLFEAFPKQPGTRHMNYNMRLRSEEGNEYYFSGFKSVPHDHSILHAWHDTSTLYVTVFKGVDAKGEVVGSGVLHIKPFDFAKQMTTMKVTGAENTGQRLEAVAQFGKYFAGVMWDSYGGLSGGRSANGKAGQTGIADALGHIVVDLEHRVAAALSGLEERIGIDQHAAVMALLQKTHDEAERAIAAGPDKWHGHVQWEFAHGLSLTGKLDDRKPLPKNPDDLPTVVNLDGSLLGCRRWELLDPRWGECLINWVKHLELRAPFGAEPAMIAIPNDVNLALVGDWGTGDTEHHSGAMRVAGAVRALNPDFTVHLGDVYPAGTARDEINNMAAWPQGKLGSFALNSNHEMYDGGFGYFAELARNFPLQRGTSYFSMQNDHWIIAGLDSAYYSEKADLYMDGNLEKVQMDWLAAMPKGRKVMILSHHQAYDITGAEQTLLYAQVRAALGRDPDYWYWGHLHNVICYEAKGGFRGRCIGHGAIPYGYARELEENSLVNWVESELAGDADYPERVFNGFASVRLNGDQLTEQLFGEDGSVRWTGT
jgi:cholesterol oxidase